MCSAVLGTVYYRVVWESNLLVLLVHDFSKGNSEKRKKNLSLQA